MSQGRPRFRLALLPTLATLFVVLVCVTILGLNAWREWETRGLEIKDSEIDLANLAASLAQHAEDTFELADTVLTGVVGRLETEGFSPESIAKAQTILNLRKPTLGRIRALFVYDENGRWLATTEKGDFSNFNNNDREYFRQHRAVTTNAAMIGRPVKSKAGGQWIIPVSRRINHADGSFAGVALATIDVEYFSDFYRRFDLGTNGSVSLLTESNIILARMPADERNIGRDVSDSPLFAANKTLSGVRHFQSSIDGRERLGFFTTNDRYGFTIAVSKTQDDILAQWRKDVQVRIAVVGTLVLLIAMLGLYLVHQMVKSRRMALALAAKEADFRILAEESSDMVTRIAYDGTLLYVSPSVARILGWRPEQLVGTQALAGAHPDDLPNLQQTVAGLRGGQRDEARVMYRTRHKERGEVWVESTMRVTRSASGRVTGVVAITRDVTEQKDIEEKLEAMATHDALTGLANRRRFDEVLQTEWGRARREGTNLALLMVDADHFKTFNDRYGHPAGDACLQSIAKVLAEIAQRPGDLAARYGGEEFAVLLPNTDAAGSRQVGERIRRALAELRIPHELNPPCGEVTVSIGVAVADARMTKTSLPSTLVDVADIALYNAKHQGRNRVVISGELRAIDSAQVA